jgi:hypothetical protein
MTKNVLALLVLCGAVNAIRAETVPLSYAVRFKDAVVATQVVTFVQDAGGDTVRAEFAADLHVFIATHHYAEEQTATHRADGTVSAFRAVRVDGMDRVELEGRLGSDDVLQVVRQDAGGVSTNFIPRADYDFSSLMMYGHAPESYLPTNAPARVLDILQGRVIPVMLQSISESITVERQNVKTRHLVWTDGEFISHSWHPERFNNLPSRYLRHNGSGVFDFTLQR